MIQAHSSLIKIIWQFLAQVIKNSAPIHLPLLVILAVLLPYSQLSLISLPPLVYLSSLQFTKDHLHGFMFTILPKRKLPDRSKTTLWQASTQEQENQNKLDSSTFFPTKTAPQAILTFHGIILVLNRKTWHFLKFSITQCLNTMMSLSPTFYLSTWEILTALKKMPSVSWLWAHGSFTCPKISFIWHQTNGLGQP